MINIRRAVVSDADAIAAVHVTAWREAYHGIVPDDFLNNLSVQRREQQWSNMLAEEGNVYHRAFVAEVDGQVAGFSNYGLSREKDLGFDGELFAIYILRSAHRRGVGRKLVNEAVRGLRELGCKSMLVWVLKDNPARGFYERLGGEYLFEKPIEIGAAQLLESAYGWRELDKFPA